MFKINEVAKLVGVSVRTLHHYDEIDLFKPTEISEARYRFYSEEDLVRLQQILFFRELGFTLKEIKKIVQSPSYDQKEALQLQKKMLLEKREQVDNMLETVDKTIRELEGEIKMTQEERFFGFNKECHKYEEEAKERWGEEVVDESHAKLEKLTINEQKDLANDWDIIFKKLGKLQEKGPEDEAVQLVIKEWYEFLNNNFCTYSLEAFEGLGQLYIMDERFTKNIDKYGNGVAQLMSEAMRVFASNNKEG